MIRLLLLIAAEAVAVAGTGHASQPYRPPAASWSTALSAAPAEVLVALVHLGAWAAAWWLLAGTVHDLVGAVARRSRVPAGRRVAPRWVQRAVDQAVGTALAVAVLAGPAAAATAAPGPAATAVAVVPPPIQPIPLPGTPPRPPAADVPGADADDAAVADTDAAHDDAPAEAAPPVDAGAGPVGQHVVAAGENLWVIARGVLLRDGATPSDRDVHAYWVRLIQANDVPSGDPDLIHPGDVLQLPSPRTPGGAG